MPRSKVIKTAFNHAEGTAPRKYEQGLRIVKKGKISVSVKRTAGTAVGTLKLFKTDSPEDVNVELGSTSWGDESVTILNDVDTAFEFLAIEAEFIDNQFGQVEVSITTL